MTQRLGTARCRFNVDLVVTETLHFHWSQTLNLQVNHEEESGNNVRENRATVYITRLTIIYIREIITESNVQDDDWKSESASDMMVMMFLRAQVEIDVDTQQGAAGLGISGDPNLVVRCGDVRGERDSLAEGSGALLEGALWC